MKIRRRLLLLGLPIALVLLGVSTWTIWTKVAVEASTIRPGMTLAEVEEILGGPADDAGKSSKGSYPRTWRTWHQGDRAVTVHFDMEDRVGFVERPESLLDRLGRWLRF